MNYWLMKSEPGEVSIDDVALAPGETIGWFGIRNYQARNFMRDEMKIGDVGFFYHSSCAIPGIAGLVEIVEESHPDPTQFEPDNEYFDPKATKDKYRWVQVKVKLISKTKFFPLAEIRKIPGLEGMRLLQKGNRLSITPVTLREGEILLIELKNTFDRF